MSVSKEKERIRSLFGINRQLGENPDIEHSVTCHNGTFVPMVNGDVCVYKGIPFALPPVGERRWKKPVPAEESNGIYEAYYNGHSPIQTLLDSERASFYPQSEDCLYLNVFANGKSTRKDKPIMVFIHGGSYGWGGTADPLYDGTNFVKLNKDVVLITIAYRTGIFGFIDFSSVEGGEDYPDAPNLGLLDQIEALRYIKKNGAAFGGNVDNITVFGESAGGGSVSLLPLIKEAKGLFHRVIAESGSVCLTYSIDECQPLTKKLLEVTKASSMDELANMPIERLIEANKVLNDINNFPMRDGRLIPLDPYKAYEEGDIADIDMIIGTNANEMNYWIGELGGLFAYAYGLPIKFKHDLAKVGDEDKLKVGAFLRTYKSNRIDKISEFYNEIMFRLPAIRQAESHSSKGGKTYMYYWKVKSKIPLYKACHAVELAYVFNNPHDTVYIGEKGDEQLAKNISMMWASFAENSDPSIPGVKWERYDPESRSTLMVMKKGLEMGDNPLASQRELLDPVVDYMINPGYGDLDLSMPFLPSVKAVAVALHNSLWMRIES